MKKLNSMSAIFHNNADIYKYKPLVAYREGENYVDITWQQIQEMVIKTAIYLKSLGVKKGDRIAIFSENRYEWWVADLAINSISAITVPVHAVSSDDFFTYTLKNSESKICFIDNNETLDKIKKHKRNLPKLTKFIQIDPLKKKSRNIADFKTIQEKPVENKDFTKIKKIIDSAKTDDTATIIYTSGTTGVPKGVILTNNNFISNVNQIIDKFKPFLDDSERFLSFLPLSHVLERTAGYYFPILLGAKVYFAKSVLTVSEDLPKAKPTILISVPRIYEKIHAAILDKVEGASAVKKFFFNYSQRVAVKNMKYVCTSKSPIGPFALNLAIAEKLVFSGLKEKLGMDQLKFAVSGGGPLGIDDAKFFIGMGIKVLEGFGLTETTPVTNVNLPDSIVIGSVGPAFKNTDIKISDEGEILVKGPQVMKGYYKDAKATKAAMTKNGYFKTGDIGLVDEKGLLYITGRIKDIIVTSGGKNISPQPIENKIIGSKYIAQICIIGDKRKYLSALVIPEFNEIKKYAKKNDIKFKTQSDLIKKKEINELIVAEINKYSGSLSRVEQLRRVRLLDAEWTIQTGELTPTLKVKRNVIMEKYKDIIDKIYSEKTED